jgi:hypothetical protein
VGAIVLGGYSIYRHIDAVLRDSYAQWWVADMVIEHMERNDGNWPRSWDDFAEPYEICAGRSGRPWSFEELRNRVTVDFDADPARLASAAATQTPPFHVIYLRSGKEHHWEGKEPNQMILDYLSERAKRPASHVSPMRPIPDERQARSELSDLGATWDLDDATGRVVRVNMGSNPGSPRYSDAAMASLNSLSDLQELLLGYSNITDSGMRHLVGLNLQRIDLYGTRVTDAGLQFLVGMDRLESLVLADDNFSDVGLQYVGKMAGLKLLNLNGARVTDVGLTQLEGLTELEQLMLQDTQVTQAGIDRLRARIPNCKIEN